MTDPDLLAKRLAVIDTCVRDLRELARPAAIAADIREERFVEHTLQLAIQAALDAASPDRRSVKGGTNTHSPAAGQEVGSRRAKGKT